MKKFLTFFVLLFIGISTNECSPRLQGQTALSARNACLYTYQLFHTARSRYEQLQTLNRLMVYASAKQLYIPELDDLQTALTTVQRGNASRAHRAIQAIAHSITQKK